MTVTFGSVLESILIARDISNYEAARRIGCDHSFISRLIHGSRKPSQDFITQIGHGLRLTDRERYRLTVTAGFIPADLQPRLLAIIDEEGAA